MALLKFNKGLSSNLPTTITEGSIYITTDSQEMYVDVASDKRIAISDFISVSAADLTTIEVYDNLFYYVTDTKTIVKYAGEDEEGNRIWEGINNTDQIAGINTRLLTAESEINALQTKDAQLEQAIDDVNAASVDTTEVITVTTKVGNYDVGEEIPVSDLQSVLMNMLCTDSAPTITQPTFSISGSVKYIEVGGSTSTSITGTYEDGKYEYGYAILADDSVDTTQTGADGTEKAEGVVKDDTTGATLTSMVLSYNGEEIANITSGNSISATVDSGVQTTKKTMSASGVVKYTAGNIPVSILKNKYKTKAIAANNNKTASRELFRWYIPMYSGFKYSSDIITDPANITATEIKGLTAITGETAYNATKPTSATASKAWRQYFVAIPTSYNAELSAITDSNNLPLTVEKANNVSLTFGDASISYEIFYVNLAADYDTTKITLTW